LKRSIFVAVLVASVAGAGPAAAEVEPGNIPAGTIATAYPVQQSTWYSGAFQPDQYNPDGSYRYHDLDYLAFTVARAGETLEFTLQNTSTCSPPTTYEWCPVYLSLLDQTNNQVGGANSGAGTIATYGDTEAFDWTFSTPGTYYMVLEYNGDEPAGQPTYSVKFGPPPPPSAGGPTGGRSGSGGTYGGTAGGPGSSGPNGGGFGRTAALVSLLRVFKQQRGSVVKATLTLGQWAKYVRVALDPAGSKKAITAIKRAPLGPGPHRYKLVLPARYRAMLEARHKLSLVVQVTVRGSSGVTETFNRRVTLSR
jgi:hypothetical protein